MMTAEYCLAILGYMIAPAIWLFARILVAGVIAGVL